MLINSCKKERKGNISNTEFENLNNWRVENLNNKSSTFGNLTPNWNSIYTNNLGMQTVYEISLLSSDQTFVTNGFIPKDNSEPYQAKSKIKLILFKDNKTGKITDGCYMATIADEDLHYRQTKSFTGLIYFYAKNGNFTNGWVFENGISTKSISPSTKEEYLKSKNLNFETESGTQNTGKQKLQVAANQFCYTSANPIYALGCITVGDPPQTVCTPYIKGYYYTSFCLDVNIPTDGGFIPNPSNPTNPGVPPTLPEVPDGLQEPQKEIKNNLTDPCLKTTITEALATNKDVKGFLGNLINKYAGLNNGIVINLSNGNIPKTAQTTSSFTNNIFTANIVFQNGYYNDVSKEAVVAALIHEVVHAYLLQTNSTYKNQPKEAQHNFLFTNFVNDIGNYLINKYNMPSNDAYGLAWSGMGDIYNSAGDNDTFITAPATPATATNSAIPAKTMTKTELGGAVAPYKRINLNPKGTPNCP